MHIDAARLGPVTVGLLWHDPVRGHRREPVSSAGYPEVWSPRDIRAPANQVTRHHGRVVKRIQRWSRYGIAGAPTALLDMAETSPTSAHAGTV